MTDSTGTRTALGSERPWQTLVTSRGAIVVVLLLVPELLWLRYGVTTDLGDGVTHYLAARIALDHPELLLDAWCKPLFTLLAAPFARLGFGGMIAFQALVGWVTLLALARTSALGGLRFPWLAPVLLVLQPGFAGALLTGLTEPLFGALVVVALWAAEGRRWGWAYLVLGCTAFVRAEGWVLMLWWALLALRRRAAWLLLPLAFAHVVYGIVGWVAVFHDPLWMFNQNPYWVSVRPYGHGGWAHFFREYPLVAGTPLACLTLVALASLVARNVIGRLGSRAADRAGPCADDERWLLYVAGSFAAYFAAHVVFWRFGLFNSFGLVRVLIAILPLGALVMSREWHRAVLDRLPARVVRGAAWGLAALLAFAALSDDLTTARLRALVTRVEQQRVIDDAVARVRAVYPTSGETPLVYFSHPYAAMALDLDIVDRARARQATQLEAAPPVPGSLVVWDSWFGVVEHGVTSEDLDALLLEDRIVVRADPDAQESFVVVVGRIAGGVR